MSTIKSVLFGLGSAFLAVVAWIVLSVSIDAGVGVGVVTVALETRWVTLAAVSGFVAGLWLHRRLAGRRRGR